LQAAVAFAQIKNLKKIINIKRKVGKLYNRLFKNNSNIEILPYKNNFSINIYWIYGIIIKNNIKNRLVKHLNKKNIQTRDFFVGMHNQPILNKMGIINKKYKFPISDKLEKNGIYIPSGPNITKKEILYVANTINKFFK
jgi:perosamine synthetase